VKQEKILAAKHANNAKLLLDFKIKRFTAFASIALFAANYFSDIPYPAFLTRPLYNSSNRMIAIAMRFSPDAHSETLQMNLNPKS
jgi:hypothetical protein